MAYTHTCDDDHLLENDHYFVMAFIALITRTPALAHALKTLIATPALALKVDITNVRRCMVALCEMYMQMTLQGNGSQTMGAAWFPWKLFNSLGYL